MRLLRKYNFNNLVILIILLFLFGCAPAPRIFYLIPSISSQYTINKSDKHLVLGNVMGGELTNEFEGSKIDAFSLRQALELSLKKYKLFIFPSPNPDYRLDAIIMFQKQPILALDMVVSLFVKYSLIDSEGNQIWNKEIISSYTAKFGDALLGTERLNLANEGAIRSNIELMIKALSEYIYNSKSVIKEENHLSPIPIEPLVFEKEVKKQSATPKF